MANKWLDTLTEYAHQAGEALREIRTGALETYNELAPKMSKALEVARSLTDIDQASKLVDDYTRRIMADSNSALGQLRQAAIRLQKAFQGAPAVIAGRLAAYTAVQETASAKKAFELPEVQACEQHVQAIEAAIKRYKSDPHKDLRELTKLGEEFDKLMEAAAREIDAFDADEQAIGRKVKNTALVLQDINTAETDRAAAEQEYHKLYGEAKVLPATDGIVSVDALKQTVAEAETSVTAGNFARAAIQLRRWDHDAAAVLEDKKAHTRKLQALCRVPRQKKGVLDSLASAAQDKGVMKGELSQLYLAANTAIKARPYNAADAEAKFNLFYEAVSPLIEDKSAAPSDKQ